MPDLDGKVGIMEISTTAGVQILNRAWQSTENANQDRKPDSPKILSKEEVRQIFREALEAEPLPPTNFTVYFKTDSAALSVNSLPQMTKVFDAIRVRKTADIVVSGHTDATGTTNYNRNLSLKRARVIAYLLVDRGIDRRNIQVTYYGKGNPLIPTPDGMAEPRNRRVEISIR
ncbi:MAG: OmpA family protein [Smithella sp.]